MPLLGSEKCTLVYRVWSTVYIRSTTMTIMFSTDAESMHRIDKKVKERGPLSLIEKGLRHGTVVGYWERTAADNRCWKWGCGTIKTWQIIQTMAISITCEIIKLRCPVFLHNSVVLICS